MKTLLIYTSVHHGNTENIGRVIAETLNADFVKVKDFQSYNINDYDLIGFGSGIYMSKFHKSITDLIEDLPLLSGRKAFVFSTSGIGKAKFNRYTEESLEEKGMDIVGSFACKGFDTFGPFKLIGGIAKGRPNEEDMDKAREFGNALKKYI